MSTLACEWRPVAGFPYDVSSDGRVRRATGGSNNAKPGRVLKGYTDKNGYVIVALSKEGKVHYRKVHRLVCVAFHGTSQLPEVRHLDGNPANNHQHNLAWGTQAQNAADRDAHGRTRRGALSPRAKLTEAQVQEVRAAYAQVRMGRKRVPRGWVMKTAPKYGMTVNGMRTVLAGRGYDRG